MDYILIFCALLGFVRAQSEITIGLVLDDVSMINATDLNSAIGQVNSDASILGNTTVKLETVVLNGAQYAQKQSTFRIKKLDLLDDISSKDGTDGKIYTVSVAVCDAASKGITSAISVTRCRNLPDVKSAFNNFNIPVVNIGPGVCPDDDTNLFLNMEGHVSNMATFVRDIVRHEKWQRTHIFYDSSFSFDILDELQVLLSAENIYTTLINLAMVTDIEATMSKIYNQWSTDYWRYMIAANTANTMNILEKALLAGLRGKGKVWMILNPDVPYTTIESKLDVLDNIGVIRKVIRKESWLCEPSQTAVSKLVGTIAGGYKDLIDAGVWTEPTVANCSGTWTLGDELMAFTKARTSNLMANCLNYTQYELRTSRLEGSSMVLRRGAYWNKVDGMTMEGQIYPNRYTGFNGKTFLVGTLAYSFFQRKTTYENGSYSYTGLTMDIMDIIARNLNFSIQYTEPDDKYWGAPDADGNWNGLIRQVMQKEVDITAACHSVTAARASVVDFADAYYFEPSIIMLKNPGAGSRLTVYIEPLHKWVWLCTFASMPVMGLLLWLFTRYSPFYTNQDESCYAECKPLFDINRCWWYIYGSMWQQGQSEMPRAMSGRFLLVVWWTFVVVILATYSGNLIAFLTVTKVTLPISSLGDLSLQDDLSFGTVKGTALWNLLEVSNAGAPKRVWESMDKVNQPDTYAAGKEMVLTGDYALITELSFYEDEASNNCELTKVPKEEFFFGSYGIAVPKGSSLRDMISEQINAMSESGVLNKLTQDWVPRQKCAGLTYTESKPATLEDASGAFIVLGFGVGFGIIALVIELIYFYGIRDKVKGKKLGWYQFGSEASVRSNKVTPFTEG